MRGGSRYGRLNSLSRVLCVSSQQSVMHNYLQHVVRAYYVNMCVATSTRQFINMIIPYNHNYHSILPHATIIRLVRQCDAYEASRFNRTISTYEPIYIIDERVFGTSDSGHSSTKSENATGRLELNRAESERLRLDFMQIVMNCVRNGLTHTHINQSSKIDDVRFLERSRCK